jgi:thymidylate synthase ThyX
MTEVSANVILDSRNPFGQRLTTLKVTAHRFILAEINTHRALTRNYRSSRAVPFAKLLAEANDPAMPVAYMKNRPGMVSYEKMTDAEAVVAQLRWCDAAEAAVDHAKHLAETDIHKSVVNRILEPYLFVHGVISATEWNNFYTLRLAPDAQPEFQALALAMRRAMDASEPRILSVDQWHLPYVDDYLDAERLDKHLYGTGNHFYGAKECEQIRSAMRKLSVARVARVSIKPHDGSNIDVAKDILLHDRLLTDHHMSPFEHVAMADETCWQTSDQTVLTNTGPETQSIRELVGRYQRQWGNFRGFVQYRKTLPEEFVAG